MQRPPTLRMVGFPAPLGLGDYDDARKWISEFFMKNENVTAIYEYGTVASPGLSDLDIIVVLKDRPKSHGGIMKALVFKSVPSRLRRLLKNDAVKFVSKMHFRRLNILDDIRCNLVAGERIGFETITASRQSLVKVASVMDFLPERVLSLMECRTKTKIPLADVVGLLNSYIYSARAAEKIIGKRIDRLARLTRNFSTLRNTWFKEDPVLNMRRLFSLVTEGVDSGVRLVELLALHLALKGYYSPAGYTDKSFFYFKKGKGLCFCDCKCHLIKKKDSLFLLVPDVWLSHLCCYARHRGPISDMIRNNLILGRGIAKMAVSEKMTEILSSRIRLCNEITLFFKRHGIPLARAYRFAHLREVGDI